MKIAFLHNILSPHNVPLFAELSRYQDLNLQLFILAASDPHRPWKNKEHYNFSYTLIPQKPLPLLKQLLPSTFYNPKLLALLNDFKPDCIIISGWDQLAYWQAVCYGKRHHIPVLLWSGSTALEPSLQRSLTKPLVRWFIKQCAGFIAYGTRSRDYLISLAAPAKNITIAYNTINLALFTQANTLRQRHSNTMTVLYYGQLITRKGPLQLLQAWQIVQKAYHKNSHNPPLRLIMIGNGPLQSTLQNYIKDHNLADQVELLPYPGEEKMIPHFAAADLFILPSAEEVWGLVINQAMAAGLPVIATSAAGASADLIQSNRNGLIIDNNQPTTVAQAILQLLQQDYQSMGRESFNIIKNFSPQKQAASFYQAIVKTCKPGSRD